MSTYPALLLPGLTAPQLTLCGNSKQSLMDDACNIQRALEAAARLVEYSDLAHPRNYVQDERQKLARAQMDAISSHLRYLAAAFEDHALEILCPTVPA